MPCHHPAMASHAHVHVVVGRPSTGTRPRTRTRTWDLLDRHSSRWLCFDLLVEPGARHARRPSGRPAQMHVRSARGVFPRLSLLASDEHGARRSHVDLEMDPGDPEGDRVARLSYQCIHTSTPGGPRGRCRSALVVANAVAGAVAAAIAIVDTHPIPSASRARSLVRRRPCCYRKLPLSYTQFRYPARSSSDPGTAIEHWRALRQPQQPVRSTTPRLHLPLHAFADYYLPSRSCPLSAALAVPVPRPPPSPLPCCSIASLAPMRPPPACK
jgi:hypothetical protein